MMVNSTAEGSETRAVSFKGAHFPKEVILMDVRWYVAYVRRESGMDKCGNTIEYTGTREPLELSVTGHLAT